MMTGFRVRQSLVPAALVLAVGLLVTALITLEVRRELEDEARQRFAFAADQVSLKISERLNSYAVILKGGAGLFAASEDVSREEWRSYVDKLQLDDSLPGIQGVGFTRLIPADRLDAHQQEVRRQGFPDYVVRPPGERPVYSSIIYLEPFNRRNQRAFGFDMFSEQVRREAMERARDSGQPALSGKVVLVQETGQDVQAGTLMYVPVYRRGMPAGSVEERRAALLGWSYSPYRMNDLMSGMLSGLDSEGALGAELHIHDGESVSTESLLFDRHGGTRIDPQSLFYQQRRLSFGGRQWTLLFDRAPGGHPVSYANAWVVGSSGTLISALLAGLLFSLRRTQSRAESIARELTETLRTSEQVLRASEAKFATLFKKSPVPAALTRIPEYVFADANQAYLDLVGYTHDELVGKTSLELGIYDETQRTWIINLMNSHKDIANVELTLHAKSGRESTVIAQFSRAEIDGHQYVLSVTRDISEQRHSEQTIRQLSQAVEQSPESIVITDAAGIIVYANETFARITGYSREEAIGKNPRVLQSGKTAPETYTALWNTLLRGETWRGEFVNRRKDGSEFAEMAIISPLRQADGRVTHYVAVKEDITEVKRLRLELDEHRLHLEQLVSVRTAELEVATAEARAANQAKSDFLANMSHEIRTPLNGVLGLAQIGMRDHAELPRTHGIFRRIIDSGQLLLTVINDILDLSKIEAGKLVVESVPVSPRTLAENALHNIESAGNAKSVALGMQVANEVPEACLGDPVRITQVLLNLLTNAVKFTERGEVRLAIACAGDRLEFSVTDTGIGISHDQLERLFLPFEQADSSTTRRFGGTGLGLAISRRLAELMGGELSATSVPGQGSTFTLRLPLTVATSATVPGAPGSAGIHRLDGLRLLVADDYPVNRFILQDILEAEGGHVVMAENGQQALEAVAQAELPFDAVLMDVEMPVMDGLEATRRLRERHPDLPVIGQTAHALAESLVLCRAAGMAATVTKPIDIEELMRTILEVTARAPREG